MRELEGLERRMENMFDRFFVERLPSLWEMERPLWRGEGWIPAVESRMENGNMIVKADLPGVDPKDVSISVTGNQLTIAGERKHEEKKEEKDYFYQEVQYGKFSRTMTLPDGVDADKIKANYKDGVLQVTMPAPKALASKKIQIEAK
jgi:HSP20 family protein